MFDEEYEDNGRRWGLFEGGNLEHVSYMKYGESLGQERGPLPDLSLKDKMH